MHNFTQRKNFFRKQRLSNREKKCSKKKAPDEIRIICLGDSTTYGDGVSYESAYPYLLEKLLKEKYPHKNINVLNAGLPGMRTRILKRFFQFHLVKYNPDIVIWRDRFNLTDQYHVNIIKSQIKFFIWKCLYNSKLFRIICILNDRRLRSKPYYSNTANMVYDFLMKKKVPESNTEKFNSDFQIVQKIAKENGIKHVIGVDYVALEGSDIISNRSSYVEKGIESIVFTFPEFKKKMRDENIEKEDIFIDNCHLTKRGNYIIAKDICEYIIKYNMIK